MLIDWEKPGENDFAIAEEGTIVAADGIILQSNDFAVNESILTGEAFSIYKNTDHDNNKVYQGTLVVGGLALFQVSAIGQLTSLGKIGKSLEEIEESKTPLQIQIENFVKKMAFVGILVFILVWGINFFLESLCLRSEILLAQKWQNLSFQVLTNSR